MWVSARGKLTAVAVEPALANPGTYQDGDGLFLRMHKRGGACCDWRLKQDGRRRDIGLGSARECGRLKSAIFGNETLPNGA